jgi:SAM domain (Sterile alpha motif)
MNTKMNDALRILFRVRGEGPRIEVADAVARPAYTQIGLGGAWGNGIGAARVCKNIRNQYAHCHWRRFPDEALRFINLDQEVTSEGRNAISRRSYTPPPIVGAVMDIVVWLRSLGLQRYEAAFRENEIDETVLPSLTEEHLKQLGVTALGHRLWRARIQAEFDDSQMNSPTQKR